MGFFTSQILRANEDPRVPFIIFPVSDFLQNKTLKRLWGRASLLPQRRESRRSSEVGLVSLWCASCIWREREGLGGKGGGRSVGGDLRDLRLGRLVGGLDEHGLGELLARRHRHLLDLVELLQHTEPPHPRWVTSLHKTLVNVQKTKLKQGLAGAAVSFSLRLIVVIVI